MRKQPATIDEVLEALDEIIEQSKQDNDYIGLFAYVYRRTTAAIRQGIKEKMFDDGERMEHFDVIFANLYLQAYQDHRSGKAACKSWTSCFEARFYKMTILQHVLMGMNAHINLDLGIAAARTADGRQILQMKEDFMKVNDILNRIIDDMQASISKVSRLMFIIDWAGGRQDEKLIDFGIRRYRDQAWHMACELALADEKDKKRMIAEVDDKTARLCNVIRNPPHWGMRLICRMISLCEEKNTSTILSKLREDETNERILVAQLQKPSLQ